MLIQKTKSLFLKIALMSCLLIVFSENLLASDTKKSSKDTTEALVIYGDEFLVAELTLDVFNSDDIAEKLDSLLSLNLEDSIHNQLLFFKQIREMEKAQVSELIDSLFGLNDVPFALINQINLFVVNELPYIKKNFAYWEDTSSIPASSLYKTWNSEHAFIVEDISDLKDTTLILQLEGDLIGYYQSPLDKIVVTSFFGPRYGRQHKGIDLDLEVWDPVKVVFPGVVKTAKYYGGYGRVVVVRHYNGLETLYAHLHKIKVKPGDKVNAGDVIGLGGSSGRSTGSHLHFECRFRGWPINPKQIIDFNEERLITDKLVIQAGALGLAAFPEGTNYHVVKKGDTLYDICQQYGTDIRKVCEINGIQKSQTLRVGQKIRVS
jgi:murein DD-endopeptidase MepM/ murein hydrolase activator NlpD